MRVVSVAGIDVRVHASMLLLVGLVILASVGEPGGVTAGVLWLVMLFGSVLVHELAHSIVARRVGVAVEEIELLPLGGVSKMDRIPDRPADELAIAIAGPLTSLGLGLVAFAAAVLMQADLWPPDLVTGALAARLAWLNVILATFNMVPALPLDGGRVLRAAIETRVGPTRATHIAARAGHYFAIALIILGLLANVWLIIIGVFILVASDAEDAGAIVHEKLGHTTAAEIMTPVTTVAADTPLDALAALDARVSPAVAVVDADGQVVGLVALHDVAQRAARALRKESTP